MFPRTAAGSRELGPAVEPAISLPLASVRRSGVGRRSPTGTQTLMPPPAAVGLSPSHRAPFARRVVKRLRSRAARRSAFKRPPGRLSKEQLTPGALGGGADNRLVNRLWSGGGGTSLMDTHSIPHSFSWFMYRYLTLKSCRSFTIMLVTPVLLYLPGYFISFREPNCTVPSLLI